MRDTQDAVRNRAWAAQFRILGVRQTHDDQTHSVLCCQRRNGIRRTASMIVSIRYGSKLTGSL
jgi:hypothetical protein